MVELGVWGSCYYAAGRRMALFGGGEVVEAGRFGEVEGSQDCAVAGGEFAALGDLSVVGGEGDEVHSFESRMLRQVSPQVVSATRSRRRASHWSWMWARMRSSRWW